MRPNAVSQPPLLRNRPPVKCFRGYREPIDSVFAAFASSNAFATFSTPHSARNFVLIFKRT